MTRTIIESEVLWKASGTIAGAMKSGDFMACIVADTKADARRALVDNAAYEGYRITINRIEKVARTLDDDETPIVVFVKSVS